MPAECGSVGAVCTALLTESQRRLWSIETSTGETDIRLPVFAYPAWSLVIDDQPAAPAVDPATGLIRVRLSSGRHAVGLYWSGAPYEKLGAVLGLASTGVLILLAVPQALRSRELAFDEELLPNIADGNG